MNIPIKKILFLSFFILGTIYSSQNTTEILSRYCNNGKKYAMITYDFFKTSLRARKTLAGTVAFFGAYLSRDKFKDHIGTHLALLASPVLLGLGAGIIGIIQKNYEENQDNMDFFSKLKLTLSNTYNNYDNYSEIKKKLLLLIAINIFILVLKCKIDKLIDKNPIVLAVIFGLLTGLKIP